MKVLSRRATLAGMLSLSACAPVVQHSGSPPLGFSGPRLDANTFVAADGTALPMNVWAAEGEPWAVLVALHGMGDYARAFDYGAGAWWASQGVTTYAYDQRGFGRSPNRGLWGGQPLMAEDLRTAVALARARHPKATIAVLGHSMGGAVAITAFASDHPPAADRLIVAAPAVWGWREQPLTNKAALWISAHVAPSWSLSPPDWLTRKIHASDNIPVLIAMGRDPNMIFRTRVDAIYGLMQLMQQADDQLGRVKAPVLYLYGARDEIIPKDATLHAARGLKPTDRSAYYPHGYHLLTRDLEGPKVWADVVAYLRDKDAPLPSGVGGLPAA